MNIRNKVTLIGAITSHPELISRDNICCAFTLSTREPVRNDDGEWVTRTDHHRIKAFGLTADSIVKYCKKDTELVVDGRLITLEEDNSWTTYVEVNNFLILSKKSKHVSDNN